MATRKELLGAAAHEIQSAQHRIATVDIDRTSTKFIAITAFKVIAHLALTLGALVAWAAQVEAEFDPEATEESPPEQQ